MILVFIFHLTLFECALNIKYTNVKNSILICEGKKYIKKIYKIKHEYLKAFVAKCLIAIYFMFAFDTAWGKILEYEVVC